MFKFSDEWYGVCQRNICKIEIARIKNLHCRPIKTHGSFMLDSRQVMVTLAGKQWGYLDFEIG